MKTPKASTEWEMGSECPRAIQREADLQPIELMRGVWMNLIPSLSG